jgi:hypothetical protein
MLGIDPNLIVATDKADASREARAKAQVQAQQAEQQPQQAAVAKSISQIDPQGLKDVMSQFTGYTTPAGA